jgi:hypothetical protein
MRDRESSPFYLTQRLRFSKFKSERNERSGKRLVNPFARKGFGDYELEYMGSAEFEFGAIPEAKERLAAAGDGLMLAEFTYGEHRLDFLWIESEGEPFDVWKDWVEGRRWFDGRQESTIPLEGQERPWELEKRLAGEQPPKYMYGSWSTDVWWGLEGNVLFAFADEDRHLHRLIESMDGAVAVLAR